jgi:hypothetical protein
MPYDAMTDYNGDGRSDVLWLNTSNNTVTNWLGNGDGTFASNFDDATHHWSHPWMPLGVGDFNGDGRDDLLWSGPNHTITNWLAQAGGGFSNNQNFTGEVSTGWNVRGVGDFNGDGRDDVLWQNFGTGQVTNWLGQADGSFISNFANADHNATPDWRIVGVGDFNGDGRDDILWRHDAGTLINWLGQADGSFVSSSQIWHADVSNEWRVVGIGDFTGEGRDDILWERNSDGLITDWLGQPNGGFVSNFANATHHIGEGWRAAGIGDYNGDQRDDVLWIHSDGGITNWLALPNSSGGFSSNFAGFYAEVSVQSGESWSTFPHYF